MMANRCLLHKSKIKEFEAWLGATGIEHRAGNGAYEVLQIRCGAGWMPIFTKLHAKEHLSVPEPLIGIVIKFLREGQKKPTPSLSYLADNPSHLPLRENTNKPPWG